MHHLASAAVRVDLNFQSKSAALSSSTFIDVQLQSIRGFDEWMPVAIDGSTN